MASQSSCMGTSRRPARRKSAVLCYVKRSTVVYPRWKTLTPYIFVVESRYIIIGPTCAGSPTSLTDSDAQEIKDIGRGAKGSLERAIDDRKSCGGSPGRGSLALQVFARGGEVRPAAFYPCSELRSCLCISVSVGCTNTGALIGRPAIHTRRRGRRDTFSGISSGERRAGAL
jgi:hypothetical protein